MVKKIINIILVLILLSCTAQAKGRFEIVGKSPLNHGATYRLLKLKDDRLLIVDYDKKEPKKGEPKVYKYETKFEIYNIRTQEFEEISQPNIWRDIVEPPILLDDGKVFLMGTYCPLGEYTPEQYKMCNDSLHAEIYDPDTDTYKIVGRLQIPREDYGISKLPDGKVLISNGSAIDRADIPSYAPDKTDWYSEIYDPATEKFTIDAETSIKTTMKYAKVNNNWYEYDYFVKYIKDGLKPEYPKGDLRNRIPAPEVTYKEYRNKNTSQKTVTLDNGEILILYPSSRSAEIYDPENHKYRCVRRLTAPNSYCNLYTFNMSDGRIGLSCPAAMHIELFDPKNEQTTSEERINLDSFGMWGLLLKSGKILFYSGVRYSGYTWVESHPLYTMKLYDPKTDDLKVIDKNPKYMRLRYSYQLEDGSVFFLADVKEKTIGVIYRNKELIGEP